VSSIKVGNAEITALVDMPAVFPLGMVFADVPREAWKPYEALYPESFSGDGLRTNFQSFIVRSPAGNVMVDCGAGPGPIDMLGGARGQLMDRMGEAGIDFNSISAVVFTHLHFDHTGWAMRDGRALCPNATYYAPEADWAMLGRAEAGFTTVEALKPLLDSGKLQLISGEKQVTPEMTTLPTPGHTPGHQSIVISSAGQRAFIAGDIAATQAILDQVEWVFGFDGNPQQAIETRRRVVERLLADGSIAAFGHFPTEACIGRLVNEGGRRIFRAL
jgi:glyoxylase-like metal-dependent hydrolase (beta-lactamase superfamily II)